MNENEDVILTEENQNEEKAVKRDHSNKIEETIIEYEDSNMIRRYMEITNNYSNDKMKFMFLSEGDLTEDFLMEIKAPINYAMIFLPMTTIDIIAHSSTKIGVFKSEFTPPPANLVEVQVEYYSMGNLINKEVVYDREKKFIVDRANIKEQEKAK